MSIVHCLSYDIWHLNSYSTVIRIFKHSIPILNSNQVLFKKIRRENLVPYHLVPKYLNKLLKKKTGNKTSPWNSHQRESLCFSPETLPEFLVFMLVHLLLPLLLHTICPCFSGIIILSLYFLLLDLHDSHCVKPNWANGVQ